MIKYKEGIVEVKGTKEVILADFLTLVMVTYSALRKEMPEEEAAKILSKYTQKGINKFQREEDAGKKLSKILTDDLMETFGRILEAMEREEL